MIPSLGLGLTSTRGGNEIINKLVNTDILEHKSSFLASVAVLQAPPGT